MQNLYRNLDLADVASKIRLHTLNLQDYRMISPTVARVVVTLTGQPPVKEQLRASIAELFKDAASPITASFRLLSNGGSIQSIVGYVKTAAAVLPMDTVDQSKYKVMASNLLMDKADETLWEMRSGASGKYLVKQGDEDLSELAYTLNHKKANLPTLAQVECASAEAKEFAAYVDLTLGEVQHGYVVGNDDGKIQVLAFDDEGPEVLDINPEQMVEIVNLDGEDVKQTGLEMAAGPMDRAAMVEYYKKAYSYSPDYIQKIIEMIDQHAFA